MNTHCRHSGTLMSGCTLSHTGSCPPALAQIVEGHSRADKWRNMSVRGRRAGKGPKARRQGEVPLSLKGGGCQPGSKATSVGGFRLQAPRGPRLAPSTIIKSRENGTQTSTHWRAWPLSSSYSTCVCRMHPSLACAWPCPLPDYTLLNEANEKSLLPFRGLGSGEQDGRERAAP